MIIQVRSQGLDASDDHFKDICRRILTSLALDGVIIPEGVVEFQPYPDMSTEVVTIAHSIPRTESERTLLRAVCDTVFDFRDKRYHLCTIPHED